MNKAIAALLLSFNLLQIPSPAFADEACEPLQWKGGEIELSVEDGVAELQWAHKEQVYTQELPETGPGQECRKFYPFLNKGLLVVHFLGGAHGTKALHQKELLVFAKVSEDGINVSRTIELKHTETLADKTNVLLDQSFQLQEGPQGIIVELKDTKTGAKKIEKVE